MFEKEAEFYAKEKYNPKTDSFIVAVADDAFKDGAEFGFKMGIKAKVNTTTISDYPIKDGWHYVKEGDLPSDKHGHVVINQDWDKVTIRNGRFEYLDGFKADVIAWREIVPPKED